MKHLHQGNVVTKEEKNFFLFIHEAVRAAEIEISNRIASEKMSEEAKSRPPNQELLEFVGLADPPAKPHFISSLNQDIDEVE